MSITGMVMFFVFLQVHIKLENSAKPTGGAPWVVSSARPDIVASHGQTINVVTIDVTMTQARKTIAAAKFTRRLLGLLDQVAQQRCMFWTTITKRGASGQAWFPPWMANPSSLRGSVDVLGDIVAPTGESWEAHR